MKAVLLTAYGDADTLEFRDMAEPSAGPNELKVRMAGASINPIDWKIRSGGLKAWIPLDLPFILGKDAAGTVVEVGPGVKGFERGERVMGFVEHGYAEFVVAATDAWAKVPAELDLTDAGALPLVTLTGSQLVEEGLKPRAGDVVLVTGALGGVGRAAVFAAKALGASVWAGVRRRQTADAFKLGTEGIVALDDDTELAALPPLDSIADTVGGEVIQKLLARLKPAGTIGSVVGEPAHAKERGFVTRAMLTHRDPVRLAALGRAVAQGELVVPIVKKLPLAAAAEGHRLAEKSAGGKVVLQG
jgi:NADPH:quinone reductase-like Zn-dependent oxidoreductase